MTENATPILITVAPNGAKKTKAQHPHIPLNAEELAIEAKACLDAGAGMIHLHIRDDKQGHSLDIGRYRETVAAVKEAVGHEMIIQVTTEAVGIYQPKEQMAVVDSLLPESTSFAIRELCPDASYEPIFSDFITQHVARGLLPHYIVYSPKELAYLSSLMEQELVPVERAFVLCVLGKKPSSATDNPGYAEPKDLDPFLEFYRGSFLEQRHVPWSICAFGGNEQACMLYAISQGGHVRIGFENNHLLPDGSMAPNNAALIASFVAAAKAQQARPIASADWFRSHVRGAI